MKKVFTVILTLVILTCMVIPAFAAPAFKNVDVLLSGTPPEAKTGEIITLTAVTQKQGSDFTDQWIGAAKVDTVLTEDGYYVSTAELVAQESATVQYNITMTSGNSGSTFVGQASTTVLVAQTRTLSGVEVKNVGVSQTVFSTTIYGGDVYLVWSDCTETYYGKTYFVCSSDSSSKKIIVPVTIDGKQYMFDVEVSPHV